MPKDLTTRVLIAGGGVAALETLLALRVHAGPRTHIELLAPEARFTYRPVSVAEPFGRGEARSFDLEEIAADQSAVLHRDALAAVDPIRRRVLTRSGDELEWDALVVAVGARQVAALPGAVTFTGPADVDTLGRLLASIETGEVTRVAFALPSGVTWPLPLYELALLTSAHASAHGRRVAISLVTPEARALEVFGPAASEAVEALLRSRGIAVHAGRRPVEVDGAVLHFDGAARLEADCVVALPALEGPRIAGLPSDAQGFIPIDRHGRVRGLSDIYAAGDGAAFPLKQGGLATQQADAVAEVIAAAAGAALEPAPFSSVVRGLLITGGEPLYLRAEPGARRAAPAGPDDAPPRRPASAAATSALWWPPSKIAGRYLAPYLATARPVPLGSRPLEDRPAPRAPKGESDAERAQALDLTLLLADYDARWGDYALALHGLDAAEAMAGALPSEYEAKRRAWREAADTGAHARPVTLPRP